MIQWKYVVSKNVKIYRTLKRIGGFVMRKLRNTWYDVVCVIVAVAVILGAITSLCGIIALMPEYMMCEIGKSEGLFTIIFLAALALVSGLAYFVYARIIAVISDHMGCKIDEYNTLKYPFMVYVMRESDQVREVTLNNMKGSGNIPTLNGHYTVCLGFNRAELMNATSTIVNTHHDVCWEVPNSYILGDGVSCLAGPKISLMDLFRTIGDMEKNDTAFFIYYVSYPAKKSQLRHESREGEIVVIDARENAAETIKRETAEKASVEA